MPTDFVFRVSLYLMLIQACICVGYAEHTIFPEAPYVAGIVIVFLILLFHLESRVELLSIPSANRLGLFVGLVNLAWGMFRSVATGDDDAPIHANMQTTLVAMLGLLLITLIPAKLARRDKHIGDYWTLQGLGLVAAVLSGALSESLLCFMLIGLFFALAVWCLGLLYLRRVYGAVLPIPNRPPPPAVGVSYAAEPRSGLQSPLAVAFLSLAIALPLYLLTPRSTAEKLDLRQSRVEIGFSAVQMTNLNQTGELEANPAPAFEARLETETRGVAALPPDLRWRGRILRQYHRGIWEPGDIALPGVDRIPGTQKEWPPPRPSEGTIAFSVPPSLGAQVLAEPIWWDAAEPVPIATMMPAGPQPWLWVGDGSFYWPGRLPRRSIHRYLQRWSLGTELDLGPTFRITDPDPSVKLRAITHNPAPGVKRYADNLIQSYRRTGQLPDDCLDPVTLTPRGELHDQIARLFCNHLATSSEFTYTTVLTRQRKDLDPVEDFLFHTRSGHCERFASALALMLRSQGIPAVLILGFKGWERGEKGEYIVRQEHAHAWVDALIVEAVPSPPGEHDRPLSRWRTLDPTPAGSPTTVDPNQGMIGETRSLLAGLFRDYLANYTAEQRGKVLTAIKERLLRWDTAVGIAMVLTAWMLSRTWKRRSRPPQHREERSFSDAGMLARMANLLALHGFVPLPGDTPREFAKRVAAALRDSPATVRVAEIPAAWVEVYYEARYGGLAPTPARLAELEAGLLELETSLGTQREGSR